MDKAIVTPGADGSRFYGWWAVVPAVFIILLVSNGLTAGGIAAFDPSILGVDPIEAVVAAVGGYGLIAGLRWVYLKRRGIEALGLGIPEVTAHNPEPPYEPIEGGVKDLIYRQWNDADILPGDGGTAASKQFEFGIGPGCTGKDGQGNYTGQAIPPLRIKEVCESLNDGDKIRCCMESICDDDFSPAIECLSGLLQETFAPQG